MTIFILAILSIFLFSETVYGWGLATHMELAESLLTNGGLLASAVGALIIKNKKDFILGNLLADVMVAKKITRRRKASHDWTGGWRLMDHATTPQNQAFAYGFLTHLAADTVAHNNFVPRQVARNNSPILLGHLYWELMADQLINPAHRKNLRKLLKNESPIHDQHMEDYLYPEMKWFAFNRGVFNQVNRLAHDRKFLSAVKFCHALSASPLHPHDLADDKDQAYDRMLDILLSGRKSSLLKEDPNGCHAARQLRDRRRSSIILP
jgi:hypothetical protein